MRERVEEGGAGGLVVGIAGGALNVAAGVLTAIAAIATITVMVIFLLLGGPRWVEAFFDALPERLAGALAPRRQRHVPLRRRLRAREPRDQPRRRRLGGGRAAASSACPYALALALVIAILDLVPLVGATLGAGVVLAVVAFHSVTAAIVWLVFAIVYQQVENHLLQPLVYGRMVLLPPFAVLLAVLVGAKLGGVVGALGAIPVASAIQILVVELIRERRANRLVPRAALTEPL